ncbi:hypothetical protein [Agrobacterium sp. CG674]
MADQPGFSVNKETIGLVMGIVGLLGAAIGGYNFFLSGRAENSPIVRELIVKDALQDKRLDRTDEDRAATKELSNKTEKLTEAVVKLTTVIENGVITKKAEYIYPNPLPGREPISLEIR